MTINSRNVVLGPYDFVEEHANITSGETPTFDEMNAFLGGCWDANKVLCELRRMVTIAADRPDVSPSEVSEAEPGTVAYWRARASERADGIEAIIERARATPDEALVAGYLAGLAQAFLYHLVVPQPSHRRTVSNLAAYGLDRARTLAAGGRGAAKSRMSWEGDGLALACHARNSDPYVSSDAIAGRIEAMLEKDRKRSRETILKRIRAWENLGSLPRRLRKTR